MTDPTSPAPEPDPGRPRYGERMPGGTGSAGHPEQPSGRAQAADAQAADAQATDAQATDAQSADAQAADDRTADPAERVPSTFSEAFAAAARRSGIGQVAPGETPSANSLLRAMGGIRGLIESILPGLAFLVLYTFTKDLTVSVVAPLILGAIFIVVRLVTRSAVMPAVVGLLLLAISAGLALFTGKAEDNFLVGIVINAVSFVVLIVSIIARWPLIGVIVGLLTGDAVGWRADRAKFRVVLIATWCWVGLFALRLGVEGSLYLAGQPEALASAKLLLGVPLYAGMLWVTWLLVRAAFVHQKSGTEQGTEADADPQPGNEQR